MKKPKLPQIVPLALKKEEAESLIIAIKNIHFKRLTVFTLETGLRLAEAITLEWSDIVESGRAILVQNKDTFTTKSKKCRTIPLSATALSILKSIGGSSGLIFKTSTGLPWKHNNVEHRFKFAVRDAELNDKIHFHTLRHTFATWFLQRGGNIYLLKLIMGHASVRTTEGYLASLSPMHFFDKGMPVPHEGDTRFQNFGFDGREI